MRKLRLLFTVFFLILLLVSCNGTENISISFEENGGTIVEDMELSISSATVNFPEPTKEGFTFDGWFLDDALSQPFTLAALLTQSGSLTLYAKWSSTVSQITITFESNGGSSVAPISGLAGAAITAPANPTKETFTFSGWFSDQALTTAYTFTVIPSANITLFAKWTAVVLNQTISFETNGGTSVASITQVIGSAVVAPAAPTKVESTFVGWFNDQSLATPYVFSTMPGNPLTLYAKWTVNSYTISFEENGGSSINNLTQNYGTATVKPSDPVKVGSTFNGWFTDTALSIPYTFTTMPANNLTLYAKWTATSYTISFEENGGSLVTDLTQNYGTPTLKPSDPVKVGSTFNGWFTDTALTLAYSFTTMPLSNLTLYAKWTVNSYTISFEENGGSSVTDSTQNYGTPILKPINLTKTGSTFVDWYTDALLTTPFVLATMPANNITVYAKWTLNSYTISFEENGGSLVTDLTQIYGSAVVAPANFSKEGSTFGGWYTEALLTTPYVFSTMPASNLTLYAKWTVNSYTITFHNADITLINIEAFAPIVLPVDPTKVGHTFSGWYLDALLVTPNDLTVMPNRHIDLYAGWSTNAYIVLFETNGADPILPIQNFYNSYIEVDVTPEKVGHTFAGWYLDELLTIPLEMQKMPANAITLYAKWIAQTSTWSIADILAFEPNHASVEATVIYFFPNPMDPGFYVYDGTASIFVLSPSTGLVVGDVVSFDADFNYHEYVPQLTAIQNFAELPLGTPSVPVYVDMTVLDLIETNPENECIMGQTITIKSGILSSQMGRFFLTSPGPDEKIAINFKSITPMSNPFMGLEGQMVEFSAIIYGYDPQFHMWHILYDPHTSVVSTVLSDQDKVDQFIALAEGSLDGRTFYSTDRIDLPTSDPVFGATLLFETTGDNATYFNPATGLFQETAIERPITIHITITIGTITESVDVTITLLPTVVLTIGEFSLLDDESYATVTGYVVYCLPDIDLIIIGNQTGATLNLMMYEDVSVGDLIQISGMKYTFNAVPIMICDEDSLKVISQDNPFPFAIPEITVSQFNDLDSQNQMYWVRIFEISGTLKVEQSKVLLVSGEDTIELHGIDMNDISQFYVFENLEVLVRGIILPHIDVSVTTLVFNFSGDLDDIRLNYEDQAFTDTMALMLKEYLEDITSIPGYTLSIPSEHPFFLFTISYAVAPDDAALIDMPSMVISPSIVVETYITLIATLTYHQVTSVINVEMHVLPIQILSIEDFIDVTDDEFYYVIGVVLFIDSEHDTMIVADETTVLFIGMETDPFNVGDQLLLLGKKIINDNMVFIANSSDALVHTVMANNINNPLTPTVMSIESIKLINLNDSSFYFPFIETTGTLKKSPDEDSYYLIDAASRMLPIFVPEGTNMSQFLSYIDLPVTIKGLLMCSGDVEQYIVLVFLDLPGDITYALTDLELANYIADQITASYDLNAYSPGSTHILPVDFASFKNIITYEVLAPHTSLYNIATGAVSDLVAEETQITVKATITIGLEVAIVEFDIRIVPLQIITIAEFKAGIEGQTYWIRGVVVMPQVEDGPMIVADATGILFIVATLPLEVGQDVVFQVVLGSFEGFPIVWENDSVISYEVFADGVASPLTAEVMTIDDFNQIDITNMNEWGRYVEITGYVNFEDYYEIPMLTESMLSGDYLLMLPIYLLNEEHMFDPFYNFRSYTGFRIVTKGFLFPSFDDDPFMPDRQLMIAGASDFELDYVDEIAMIDALIALESRLLEETFFRPYQYIDLVYQVSSIGANISWEIVSLNPEIFDFGFMEILLIDTHQELTFRATITIDSITVSHDFTIDIYPYDFIAVEDFYNLRNNEYGKLHAVVAEVIPGYGIILASGYHLFAYGFDEVSEGDDVIIFGTHMDIAGMCKMNGYAEHAYVEILESGPKPPLTSWETIPVADLGQRNPNLNYILRYFTVEGRLIKNNEEYYLTDGMNTIRLYLEDFSLYALFEPFESQDVKIKLFTYEFTYTDMGPMWTGLIVAGDEVISSTTLPNADVLYIMMDYLQNDLNYYYRDGLDYLFSTTHPIYNGELSATIDSSSALLATIIGNKLSLSESDEQYTVILNLSVTYNTVTHTDQVEIIVHPYTDDMVQNNPGSQGALPFVDYTLETGHFGGLFVSKVDRQHGFMGGSEMVVELSFPNAESLGFSSFTLQYQDLITSVWHNYIYYDEPLLTTGDNFSIVMNGSYMLRLISDTGVVSNVVEVEYDTIETYFSGWYLDESMFLTGIMTPYIGHGLELGNVNIYDLEGNPVLSAYTIQWYRVNPITFESIAIEGETGHRYNTKIDDVGHLIMVEMKGDGIRAGGVQRIFSMEVVKLQNIGYISSASTAGFYLGFQYDVELSDLDNLIVYNHNWIEINVLDIQATADPAIYYISCNLHGANFINVELSTPIFNLGQTGEQHFFASVYADIRNW